jgi:hypothetical protein
MKKGRRYIEPMTGRGDKIKNEAAAEIKDMQTKDMKKATPKLGASGKTWDGVSRPSNDMYRESFNRIFGEKNDE